MWGVACCSPQNGQVLTPEGFSLWWQENWEDYKVKLSPVVKIRLNSAGLGVFSVNSLKSCFPWNYKLIEICFWYLPDTL